MKKEHILLSIKNQCDAVYVRSLPKICGISAGHVRITKNNKGQFDQNVGTKFKQKRGTLKIQTYRRTSDKRINKTHY